MNTFTSALRAFEFYRHNTDSLEVLKLCQSALSFEENTKVKLRPSNLKVADELLKVAYLKKADLAYQMWLVDQECKTAYKLSAEARRCNIVHAIEVIAGCEIPPLDNVTDEILEIVDDYLYEGEMDSVRLMGLLYALTEHGGYDRRRAIRLTTLISSERLLTLPAKRLGKHIAAQAKKKKDKWIL